MTSYNTVPAAEEPLLQKPTKSNRKFIVAGAFAAVFFLGALASGHIASKFESTGKTDLIFIPFSPDKCKCKDTWSNVYCNETQYRCPSKACDSYHSRWCEVDSMCSSAQKENGVYWKKCDDPELTVVEAPPNARCPAHDTQSGVKCESKTHSLLYPAPGAGLVRPPMAGV